ncbi:MAG: SDR family NAD(P)-dependent oxidoreductase [Betaproteobacteria bacterium]|jgi:NAD(P)-dependent dehydrogenase (short-subunit alcohol dehydrogenase family)|nr:SDR family NAD(P)-dependent oxidoreductase [Betaproteobacteria bacterium]NBS46996.1 SDR family NAD(P)-dependent oxidoreductase [Betaproteobacteria bacterium]
MDGPNAPAPAIGTPAPLARESAPTRAQRGASAPSRWFGPANPPITDWRGKAAWIVGASTGIGRATAALLHARGAQVFVSARNVDSLNQFVADHPGAVALPLDATDAPAVREAAQRIAQTAPLDAAVYCAGHYKPMRATALDLGQMLQHEQVNYVGALYMLDAVLPGMLARGSGHVSLVSSVAGYRGLPQSLAYGPTKAALISLAETLYVDLRDEGIAVSLISPGFVETPLTAQNEFHMPALITAEQAAQEIVAGWAHGDFEIHFPRRFTRWMKLLRLLPYRLYFPLVRRFTGL